MKYSKFKKIENPKKRDILSLILNKNNLQHYNKILNCKKKKSTIMAFVTSSFLIGYNKFTENYVNIPPREKK